MSRDEARQHIKAAQEAEIAGNREGAVRHLERAALAYLRVGQHARAAQMYKNCLRLAPDRKDFQDALEKAERWAAQRSGTETMGGPNITELHAVPSASEEPPGPAIVSGEGFDALAIPRGPQRMPEGLEAWCSFCCRPTQEVGELVAGPAGAFICAECVGTSIKMLGLAAAPAPAPPQTPAAAPRPPSKAAPVHAPARPTIWLGPEPVLLAAQAALTGRGPPLVLAGGEGTGKSALLTSLLEDRPELAQLSFARADDVPPEGALLVEQLELATPAQRAALAKRGFVATWRAEVEAEPLPVQVGEALHAFPVAKDFPLPPELSTCLVLVLGPPTAHLLDRLLERELEAAGPKLEPELKATLVTRALTSGRGAKGLLAELGMLRSLPSGAPLQVGSKPKRARKKKS